MVIREGVHSYKIDTWQLCCLCNRLLSKEKGSADGDARVHGMLPLRESPCKIHLAIAIERESACRRESRHTHKWVIQRGDMN